MGHSKACVELWEVWAVWRIASTFWDSRERNRGPIAKRVNPAKDGWREIGGLDIVIVSSLCRKCAGLDTE